MKKRYRLSENGKMLLFSIVMLIAVVGATLIYLDRVRRIDNGTFIVVSDSKCDE